MKTRIAWTLSAATLAALLWYGCDESCQDCHWQPDLPDIQIVTGLQNDSLFFLPNDPHSVPPLDITVIVRNDNGVARHGEFVSITLSDTSLGYLSYVFPSQGDLTDSLGRAYYYYHYRIRQGTQVVTAYAGFSSASRVIQSVEADPSLVLVNLSFDPDTVFRTNAEVDSTILSAQVLTRGLAPVANFGVIVSTFYTLGSYPAFISLGPTDHNGHAQTVVRITGGSLCCIVPESFGGDTACVFVLQP